MKSTPLFWGTTLKSATVLDPETLLKAGLAPALLEESEGAFRILRWTFTAPLTRRMDDTSDPIDRGAFRKIAETVANDGAYTCTVLEQREAKQGEGLYWGGPG